MIIAKVKRLEGAQYPWGAVGVQSGITIKGFEHRESAVEFANFINRQVPDLK